MQNYWDEELPEERSEAMIDRLAAEVHRRGLETPATLFLEMHKPLANIGAHLMLAASPFVVPFMGYERFSDYSALLSRPGNIEQLLSRIESGPPEKETS